MEQENKIQVIEEIVEIIKKYNCTFNEAEELLRFSIITLRNKEIKY